jgi:hypothetical protein
VDLSFVLFVCEFVDIFGFHYRVAVAVSVITLILKENPLLIMIVYEIHHTFRVITTLQQQQYLLIKNLKDPMVTVYTMQTRTRRGRSYYKEEISKLILDQMLPILI